MLILRVFSFLHISSLLYQAFKIFLILVFTLHFFAIKFLKFQIIFNWFWCHYLILCCDKNVHVANRTLCVFFPTSSPNWTCQVVSPLNAPSNIAKMHSNFESSLMLIFFLFSFFFLFPFYTVLFSLKSPSILIFSMWFSDMLCCYSDF